MGYLRQQLGTGGFDVVNQNRSDILRIYSVIEFLCLAVAGFTI